MRTKEIKIRVSEEEYQLLLERKTKQRLAEWLRDIALNEKPKSLPKSVDPKLLYELNRIGTNINQIARVCNIKKSSVDLISIALALRNIETELQQITDSVLL